MEMKTIIAASLALAFFLAGGSFGPTTAAAQPMTTVSAQAEIVSCAGGPASTTVTLNGANPTTLSAVVLSPDASYIATGCRMFAVDVKLVAISAAKYVTTVSYGYAASLTQAQCETAQDFVQLFRKPSGATTFSAVA